MPNIIKYWIEGNCKKATLLEIFVSHTYYNISHHNLFKYFFLKFAETSSNCFASFNDSFQSEVHSGDNTILR